MSNQWIQERREVFERDLIQDFFKAKLFFGTIARAYQRSDTISFEQLDAWVGSDQRKGPLWLLKDHSQRLYRSSSNAGSLYENLFDWTVGSIFHETIKLKEEAYQIASYKPLLEMQVKNKTCDETLGSIIQEYFVLIERAKETVPVEMQNIGALSNKALYHLHEIIFAGRSNMLFMGTNVRSGTGRGLVVATGRATTFDQIADRGELAAYQAQLENWAAPRTDHLTDVFVMADRETYRALMTQ